MLRSILLANRMKAFACLFIFITSFFSPLISQEEFAGPDITNYTYRDYPGRPGIQYDIEANDGLMYFANSGYLL